MRILALEVEIPGADWNAAGEHLKAEARRVWELYQFGFVREIFFRADQHTAVILMECEGPEEAQAMLNTLPLVRQGLIRFDLIPLEPYDGFARLFAA